MIPSRLQYLVPELQAVMGLLLWAVSPSHSQYLVPELRMASDQFSLARFPRNWFRTPHHPPLFPSSSSWERAILCSLLLQQRLHSIDILPQASEAA